jgi:hypothetical protein
MLLAYKVEMRSMSMAVMIVGRGIELPPDGA